MRSVYEILVISRSSCFLEGISAAADHNPNRIENVINTPGLKSLLIRAQTAEWRHVRRPRAVEASRATPGTRVCVYVTCGVGP